MKSSYVFECVSGEYIKLMGYFVLRGLCQSFLHFYLCHTDIEYIMRTYLGNEISFVIFHLCIT